MRSIKVTAILFLGISLTICTLAQASDYSDSLFLVHGASDVHFTKLCGTDQLSYHITSQYPAYKVITNIKAKLNELGWIPLKNSFLNPGLPTSHVRGWTNFEDATGERLKVVHSWWGDWTNERGEIVTYILRYDYLKNEQPDLESLSVTAIYMSKERVEEYISLMPHMKEEQERIEKQEAEKLRARVDKIRKEAKLIGELIFCLVSSRSPSKETELQVEPSNPPLLLKVASAEVKNDPGDYSSVELIFTAESAEKIKRFSSRHINRKIAIVVGGEVVSTPLMIQPIEDIAMITGSFSPVEAQEIVKKIMSK
jgi:hypothetical protein